MIISKPKPGEYADFAITYINNLPDDINLIDHMIQNLKDIIELFVSIPNDKYIYRYAEDKWTIKEVLLHIIDTERVLAYRALAYARDSETVLPGFHENVYAKNSNANNRSATDLLDELKTVRLSTISLYKSFTHEQFAIICKTTESNLSLAATAFFILGHSIHHLNILREKYLNE